MRGRDPARGRWSIPLSILRMVGNSETRGTMTPDHGVPTTIGGYRIGIASALKFGFSISAIRYLRLARMPLICNTFYKGSLAE